MARHDEIERFIRLVDSNRVSNTKIDLPICLFGFLPGAIEHPWSKVDAGDGMTELREQKRQESGATSDVQHPLRRRPDLA